MLLSNIDLTYWSLFLVVMCETYIVEIVFGAYTQPVAQASEMLKSSSILKFE